MCQFNSASMAKDIADDIAKDIEDGKCHPKLNETCEKLGCDDFKSFINVMTCRIWLKLNPYKEPGE